MHRIKAPFLQLATVKTDLQISACFKVFQPSNAHCGSIGRYQLILKSCLARWTVVPVQHCYEILELLSGKDIGRDATADDEFQECIVALLLKCFFAFCPKLPKKIISRFDDRFQLLFYQRFIS